MCRFLAYSGEPVFLSDLVCAPTHSLVHQSLHADEGKTETNGDGFGIGWYGERAEPGARVYVPPRGADPQLGKPTTEQVELSNVGTITSFCVVNVSFYGGTQEIPYVTGNIRLDGADLPIMHLIQECPVDEVRIGMRVEAVWVDEADLGPTMESIRYFRPNGEPDVDPKIPGETRPLWLDNEEFNRP